MNETEAEEAAAATPAAVARPKRQPKTTFTVSIRASGVSSALKAPRFRFALPFGNGSKATRVVTEPIASWKRVAASDGSNAESASDGGEAGEGNDDVDSGVGAADGDASTVASSSGASTDNALYEWCETYTHEGDAEWAIGVNEQPFVVVQLGDATSNVLGHARLDISPLLASGTAADTRELGFVGNRFGAIAAARAAGIGMLEPANATAARLGGKSVAVALVAGLVGPGGPFAESELVRNNLLRKLVVRIETSQAALPPAVQFELNPLVVTLRRSHPLPAPPSKSIATHNDPDAAASAAAGTLALAVGGAVVERPVDDAADSATDEGAAEGDEARATKAQPPCYVSVTFGTRASFRTVASVPATERVGGPAAAQGDAAVADGSDGAKEEEEEEEEEDAAEAEAVHPALRCTHSFAPLSGSAAETSTLRLVYGDAAAPERLVVLVELFESAAKERGARRGARARSSGSASPRGGRSPRSAPRGKLLASTTISVVDWINRGVSSDTVELDVESSVASLVTAARVSLRAQWQSPLVYAAFHLPMRGMAPGAEGEAESKAAGHGAHGAAAAGNEPRLSQAPRWTAGVAVSLDAREKTWFAAWNHTLCVLTGPRVVEQHRIRKHLDTARIALTVHDRDMQETAEHLDEQRARWAALASASSSVDDDAAWEQLDAVRVEEEAEAEHGCMGSKHPHGAASARFSELLLRNREIAAGFERTRATLRRKRAARATVDAASAAGGGAESSDPWVDVTDADEDEEDALLHLASEASIDACVVPCRARSTERLSEKVELRVPAPPGCYLESSTSLVGLARLFRSLDAADNPFKRPVQPLFERMIISFMYDNTELLHTILRVVREVNQAALPDVSLRSYQLSAAEKARANVGELDIIGGFMICDAERRLIVLEGLSTRGIHALNAVLPRTIANDASTHFLRDPTIRFTKRLYTAFEVDVKVIRLRTTLYTVMTMPRNYNTNNVDAELFAALHSMLNVQKARTMREVCAANLFPTAHALAEVESKYGETVTLLDMGIVHNKRRRDFTLSGKLQQFATAAADELDATFLRLPSRGELFDEADAAAGPATTRVGGEAQSVGFDSLVKLASKIANVKKGVDLFKKGVAAHGTSSPTAMGGGVADSAPARRKAPTDATNEAFEEYLRQRKHIVPPDRIGNALRKSSTLKRAAANMMVSKQRAAEKQWEEDGPYYQYSGQRLRTLDAEKEKMRLRIAKDLGSTYTYSKAGDFVSLTVSRFDPDSIERIQADQAKLLWTTKRGFVYPPPRRKEEYAKHPKDVSDTRKADLREPWIENEGNGFGAEAQRGTGLDPHIVSVHGVRDFDSVPCKGKDFGPNELFTTVFTGGVKLRAEEKEARRAEAEEWQSKVVVDNLTVRSHIPTKKPSQQDKIKGIRRGAAKTVALRGGKNGPIKTFPVSISMQEEYEDPVDFTEKMRSDDPEKMAAAGHTEKFQRHIHHAKYVPKHQKMVYHHKHYGVDESRIEAAKAAAGGRGASHWADNRREKLVGSHGHALVLEGSVCRNLIRPHTFAAPVAATRRGGKK